MIGFSRFPQAIASDRIAHAELVLTMKGGNDQRGKKRGEWAEMHLIEPKNKKGTAGTQSDSASALFLSGKRVSVTLQTDAAQGCKR